MNTRSIRFRLTVWYAVALSTGLGILCTLLSLSLSHQLSTELDGELSGRASRLEAYFREEIAKTTTAQLHDELEEFSMAFGPGSYVEIKGLSGFDFHHPQQEAQQGRVLLSRFSVNDQQYDLKVKVPTMEMDRTIADLHHLLAGLIPLVMAISLLGGALLSGRALHPVIELTEAARSISIENLAERLPVANTGDEIASLGATLNTMLCRLEDAVTTLSQFTADASHEFRTPLAIIQTSVELALRRPRSADEYRQSLEEVSDEVTRMTRLVDNLLALARTDTIAVEMPRSPVDLNSILEDVVNEARSLAEFRKVRIVLEEHSGSAWIRANRPALHRLFLVLIDNALKYSNPGETVRVGIQRTGATVTMTVHDSGTGIAPEHLPHIFKRFYRGDSSRTASGHGLGLALAQSIASAHSAQISVLSVENVSTEFKVEFTARTAPLDESEPVRSAPAG